MQVNNIQTITAIEQDGFNVRTLTIICKILNPTEKFDLENAVKESVKEYLHTQSGKRTYLYNGKCFNWADFAVNVPNEINQKHGFETIDSTLSDIIVNWDEHLADDADVQEFWGDKLEEDDDDDN